MAEKALTALITVVVGIGAALALYWLLNKFAELLPERWEARVKPYLYVAPAFLAIVLYLVYPAILTFINAFKDRSSTEWVGFENFTELFGSPQFRDTLFNTLLWIIVVPALDAWSSAWPSPRSPTGSGRPGRRSPRRSSSCRWPSAWWVPPRSGGSSTTPPRRASRRSACRTPCSGLFGKDPVAWLQQSQFHLNSFLLMVVLLWSQVGFAMVLLSAAVKGVPLDTLEAARIDGASERQIFFKVVIPQIKGTIITVFITVTIGVMKIFDIVYVMTNGGFNTNVLGNEFWNQLSTNFNNGAAAAIVVILMIAVVPIMWYQVRHFKAEEANA